MKIKIEFPKTKHKWRKGGFHTDPNFGWGIVLLISLLLGLWALGFGVLLFRDVQREYVVPDQGQEGQIRIVQKSRLEKVLEYFREREETSKEILTAPDVIDPSL